MQSIDGFQKMLCGLTESKSMVLLKRSFSGQQVKTKRSNTIESFDPEDGAANDNSSRERQSGIVKGDSMR